jgi:hypothetical protein
VVCVFIFVLFIFILLADTAGGLVCVWSRSLSVFKLGRLECGHTHCDKTIYVPVTAFSGDVVAVVVVVQLAVFLVAASASDRAIC